MAELKKGDQAPDFATVTDTGEEVKLSDYRGQRVILYFYPKDDTPGCTIQACGFRDNYTGIQEKNAVVLGVSPDDTASHQQFKQKFDLPFTLLVDKDHEISESYGVWGEKSFQGRTSMGVHRSHFVIDEDGQIVQAHYKVSPEESIQEAVQALG